MKTRQAMTIGGYYTEDMLENTVEVDYTNDEMEELVNKHNNYRRKLVRTKIDGLNKISNMNRLVCGMHNHCVQCQLDVN